LKNFVSNPCPRNLFPMRHGFFHGLTKSAPQRGPSRHPNQTAGPRGALPLPGGIMRSIVLALCLIVSVSSCQLVEPQYMALSPEQVATLEAKLGDLGTANAELLRVEAEKLTGGSRREVPRRSVGEADATDSGDRHGGRDDVCRRDPGEPDGIRRGGRRPGGTGRRSGRVAWTAERREAGEVMPWLSVKAWERSRLVWLGIISTVIGVVEVLAKDTILTDEAKAWALVVVGMLTVVLRALTTTAIGKGEE
jgi:hypothetical protein